MDCRKSLVLALGLAGCVPQSSVQTVPPQPTAVQPAKDLPKHPPKNPETCVAAGDFFATQAAEAAPGSAKQEGLYDQARRAYQQALEIDANCLRAYQALGQLYTTMGDHERAVATYAKALEKRPQQASLWFDLGMCHARHKDWDRATEALRRAADIDPENRQYGNTLGHCLARAGRTDEALAAFRKVSSEGRAQYNLARMLHYPLNRDVEAREHLQAAVRAEPTLEDALRLLAQLEGRAPADPGPATAGFDGPAEGDTPRP